MLAFATCDAPSPLPGGTTLPMIGRLLGHSQAQTALRYAHLYDDLFRAGDDQVGEALRPELRVVSAAS